MFTYLYLQRAHGGGHILGVCVCVCVCVSDSVTVCVCVCVCVVSYHTNFTVSLVARLFTGYHFSS